MNSFSPWPHFEELRKRLWACVMFLVLLSAFSYLGSDFILNFLTMPVRELHQKIYFTSPYDAFLVKLHVSFWTALFMGSPFFLTEIWLFAAPGLYRREKKIFWMGLSAAVLLFLLGAALALLIIIPTTLKFFLSFATPELEPLLSIQQYLHFVVWMMLSFGLSFTLPIMLVGLARLGILPMDQIQNARPFIVVGIFVFSAVVTPSPDPFSQCLLALPLWVLFETSLFAARFFRK